MARVAVKPRASKAAAATDGNVAVVEAVKEIAVAPVEEAKKYFTYEDYDFDDLCKYGAVDTFVTHHLVRKLHAQSSTPIRAYDSVAGSKVMTEVKAPFNVVKDIQMPICEFILDLEYNGFRYDVDGNRRMKERGDRDCEEMRDQIFSNFGKTINLDSSKELISFLYEEKGYPILERSKGGDPATDGATIKKLFKATGEKGLEILARYREVNATLNTFVRTYVPDYVKRDGRIHPRFQLHTTSSFRLTGEDPNLTQLPNERHGYNLRELYTVDDGYVFIAADFSSAEVKLLGALSKDPALLTAIAKGYDFHSFSASMMIGVEYELFAAVMENEDHHLYKEYKLARQNAKALTFGILYGSSPAGIAANLGVTVERANELIAAYFKAYPLIERYVKDSHNMAAWNQMVWTPLGHIKRQYGQLPCYKGTAVFNAAKRNSQNVRIQSVTAIVGLLCFAELNKALKKLGARSICTVHDSFEAEVPKEHAAEAIKLFRRYMGSWPVEMFGFLDLEIGMDVEVGYNWGHVRKVHNPNPTQTEIEELLALVA